MCACEPGYTCQLCRDTPHDPRYHDVAARVVVVARVVFVVVAFFVAALLASALAIPVGIAAHVLWNLLSYGWGRV